MLSMLLHTNFSLIPSTMVYSLVCFYIWHGSSFECVAGALTKKIICLLGFAHCGRIYSLPAKVAEQVLSSTERIGNL